MTATYIMDSRELARKQGTDAARKGSGLVSNPYELGTRNRAEWNMAYNRQLHRASKQRS